MKEIQSLLVQQTENVTPITMKWLQTLNPAIKLLIFSKILQSLLFTVVVIKIIKMSYVFNLACYIATIILTDVLFDKIISIWILKDATITIIQLAIYITV